MRLIFILSLTASLTACSLNPYRMENYFPSGPVMASGTATTSPQGQVIITQSGNYVITPNYTTGRIMSINRVSR